MSTTHTGNMAVIFYGPPGSGKGTQAQLLADALHLFHFDSGDYLRRLLNDPEHKDDESIKRERELNEAGKLNTPSWVLDMVIRQVNELAQLGESVVFSGSPRTLYEAFGDGERTGLLAFLKEKYGKENVHIFSLKIPDETTMQRNSHRTICSVCKKPLLEAEHAPSVCPFCGGAVEHRVDDTTEIIARRIKEYHERTEPIIAESVKQGYNVIELDGLPAPYKIHEAIMAHLK